MMLKELLIGPAAVLALGTAKSAMAGTSSLDQVNESLVAGDNLSLSTGYCAINRPSEWRRGGGDATKDQEERRGEGG